MTKTLIEDELWSSHFNMIIRKFHSDSIQDGESIYFKKWCYFHNLIQLIRGCVWFIDKDMSDEDKYNLKGFLNSLKHFDMVQKETITIKLLKETIQMIES